ncbi:MAG: CBS domain-containing protein [Acidobacteria bacterium]|nr:CBS domain-containing protein [Acidobacteriota bacterium]MDW7984786.1 CBS domain-containing protein [Acidobacteriota bacterium]
MLKVRDILPSLEVWVTFPEATVLEASRLMAEHQVGALPVVNEYGQLIGIVTERDVLYQVVARDRDPRQTSVADIMTRDVEVVDLDDSSLQALYKMSVRRCRHLPVVHDNQVVGMLSIKDILWAELRRQQTAASTRQASLAEDHAWVCVQCDFRLTTWMPPDKCPRCGAFHSFQFSWA